MRRISCLPIAVILFLTLTNNLVAFRAPDEDQFPVKSVMFSGTRLELQSILVEDLDLAVGGDLVEATKGILDDIMKVRFERAVSDRTAAGGSRSVPPPFTAEVKEVQTDNLDSPIFA